MIGAEIREMEVGDRHAVLALFSEFIQHESSLDPAQAPFVEDRTVDIGQAETYLHYCEHLIADAGGSLFVAIYNGNIAGLLCWCIATDGPYVRPEHRRIGEIQFVIVSDRSRGMGIGSQLIQKAASLTKEAGLTRLSLGVMAGNVQAVKLYERMSFRTRAYKMLKPV